MVHLFFGFLITRYLAQGGTLVPFGILNVVVLNYFSVILMEMLNPFLDP